MLGAIVIVPTPYSLLIAGQYEDVASCGRKLSTWVCIASSPLKKIAHDLRSGQHGAAFGHHDGLRRVHRLDERPVRAGITGQIALAVLIARLGSGTAIDTRNTRGGRKERGEDVLHLDL